MKSGGGGMGDFFIFPPRVEAEEKFSIFFLRSREIDETGKRKIRSLIEAYSIKKKLEGRKLGEKCRRNSVDGNRISVSIFSVIFPSIFPGNPYA